MRRSILAGTILVSFLFFCGSAFAKNWYIGNSTRGSGDGSSCTNTLSGLYPGGWNWSGVNPGDTVWICGTINVDESYQIVVQATGDAITHNPVTLKFCSESDCGAGNTGLVTASVALPMVTISNTNDLVIDGNDVGIIQCTDSGSPSAGYTWKGNPTGIYHSGTGDHITIKNLTIRNLYVHQYQTSTYDNARYGAGKAIWFQNATNVEVHNCRISDVGAGIVLSNVSNASVRDNTISRCCMAISGGASGGTTVQNSYIYNNDIEMGANWMSVNGNDCHLNGFYFWADNKSSHVENLQFYNNYIHGPFSSWANFPSNGVFGCTGFFHYDIGAGSGNAFFNNLVVAGPYLNAGISSNPSNGVVSWADLETLPKIWNNTVVGPFTSPCFGGGTALTAFHTSSNPDMRNNICLNGNMLYNGYFAPESDYNDIATTGGVISNLLQPTPYMGLSAWQTALGGGCPNASGNECNSLTTAPNLDANYQPQAASPVVRRGENLTSFCAKYPALCYDKAGNLRPVTGAWDIGAYQYMGGVSSPSGLRVLY